MFEEVFPENKDLSDNAIPEAVGTLYKTIETQLYQPCLALGEEMAASVREHLLCNMEKFVPFFQDIEMTLAPEPVHGHEKDYDANLRAWASVSPLDSGLGRVATVLQHATGAPEDAKVFESSTLGCNAAFCCKTKCTFAGFLGNASSGLGGAVRGKELDVKRRHNLA